MKQIIFSIAAIAAMTTFGLPVISGSNYSEQTFNDIADALVACTNVEQVRSIAMETKFFSPNRLIANLPYAVAAYSRVDNALSGKGIGYAPYWWKSFPKMSAIARQKSNISTNEIPFTLLLKYDIENPISLRTRVNVQEFIALMNYSVIKEKSVKFIKVYKEEFQKRHGQSLVKKYLYNQGKSFVTKDGVNPCEPMLQRLNTTLNSPRMNGFNEWLADVGVSERIDLSFLPSDGEIDQLKTTILVGEKNPTQQDLFNLYMCLSISDYNAFIDRYNNGTK